MKIDRLIGIITILLRNGKTTAPDLAERFEVSRRTINRDIEDLCKAGIPVVAAQGRGGGLSIAPGYKIDHTLLTRDELQAVFAGLRGVDSVSRGRTLTSLLDKLSSPEARAADDFILIDLASHYQSALTEKVERIKAAIRSSRVITFQYCSEKGEARRRVEPCCLVFKWSAWYVLGFCLDRQAYRLFKLNRLWELAMTDEVFTRREVPEDALSWGDEHLSRRDFHLKALFHSSERHRLIEEYGVGSYTVREDGSLLLERDFASYAHMREWVFSFGDKVTILSPEALREDRRRQAENILKEHDI